MAVPVTGAVYDRGYRPYEGARGGRRAATVALWRASIRRALGFRRPWRQKVAPWSLLAIATVPAVVNVGVGYVTRDTPAEGFEFITYREYVGVSTALLLFVALTAPDVLCPDRRQRVLPVIFARPLTGPDYVLAKLAAVTTIVFAFGFLPQVVLFVGQMLVSDSSFEYLTDNAAVLWQVPLAVAVLAVYYAAVGLALASLTTRRIIAGASLIGLLLVTSSVSGILLGPDGNGAAAFLNLLAMPLAVRDVIFLGEMAFDSPLAGVAGAGAFTAVETIAVLALAVGTLLWRYRWTET
jgi:ABC-2 type transport system permease protein